ncbi:helix-turn-helix domain-containing protein [Lactococcus lactis]|uniref:helix-turn-helix domain-containing protein n=1 Tax=Lactococcus lactis TaxID=1358 RepID=UPI00288E8FEC|nr:helix-turn-helix domain-containing protein [Lactococcus lactis]MDT2916502.1 helix-turn-helix domain-containing protein [Lactococcus lactis]
MSITSERIKSSRLANGLTMDELAEKLSAGKSTIASWENGSREPKKGKLKELSEILQVDYAYLLGIQDEPVKVTIKPITLKETFLTDDDLQIFKKLDGIKEKYNKNDNIDLLNQVSALIEENNLLRDFAEKAIKQYNYDFQYRLQEMIDVLKKPK